MCREQPLWRCATPSRRPIPCQPIAPPHPISPPHPIATRLFNPIPGLHPHPIATPISPQGSKETSLFESINKRHAGKSSYFVKSRGLRLGEGFTVRHYAADVTYHAGGFIDAKVLSLAK